MKKDTNKMIIIQGKGRGKTSNAMGRIYFHLTKQKRVFVLQFMKTGRNCGECKFFKEMFNVKWYCLGKEGFIRKEEDKIEYKKVLLEGIERAIREIHDKGVDILLLDEVGIAISFKLISIDDIQPLIDLAEEEVIITGRIITPELKKRADSLITINEIKHPYKKHIYARKGIDY